MRILISGAGIAGPALAAWLHRCGHEVVLVERAPEFRTGGYLIDFWGVGYSVAERMGILPQIRAAGYQVQEVRIVNAAGKRVGGFPVDVIREMTEDRFTSLPRGDLAKIIFGLVEERIETLFDDTVTSLKEHPDRVHVTFEKAAPRDFELVVGADGLHSAVRACVFGPVEAFEKKLGYHVAAFTVCGYRPRDELVYVCHGQPGRQVARFSMRDDQTMFLFVFRSEMCRDAASSTLTEKKAVLQTIFADAGWECPAILAAMQESRDIYFDRVSQIVAPNWSQGRVALIGDAAACVSLLAGEGTGLALTEAYVLAGELLRSGDDYQTAFRNYEQKLRPLIARKQKSAAGFASAFAPKTRFGLWFRNRISRLLGNRVLGRYFIGRDLQDQFELPEYALPLPSDTGNRQS